MISIVNDGEIGEFLFQKIGEAFLFRMKDKYQGCRVKIYSTAVTGLQGERQVSRLFFSQVE